LHLADEDVLLRVAGRVVVIIIEADLSPGYYFGPARKLLKLREIGILGALRFVRVNANGGVEKLMLRGEFDRTIEGARAIAGADGGGVCYSRFDRARDYLFAVGVEARPVQVAVGVYEHATSPAYQ